MNIKKQVVLRTVMGESMLIPVGETIFEYNGIFYLTESGKELWEQIINGAEKEQLIEYLQKEYEIDSLTASEGVAEFLKQLNEYGII